MTQNEMVKDYMERFGSISPAEAFADLGVMRLAARISDLRKLGVDIVGRNESRTNRYGKSTTYKRYSIVRSNNG